MLKQLTALFTNPKSFFKTYSHSTPIKTGLFILLLSSLSLASLFSASPAFLWPMTIVTLLFLSILLFTQTVILDFLAQALKLSPKSYPLYFWLCISLSPLCLLPALTQLQLPTRLPLTILIVTFQLWVLKNQYATSLKKALLLYFLPIAIPVIVVLFISITL